MTGHTTTPTLTRLLNTPETPPRSWLADVPDWYIEGATLRIVTTGPEEGRAAGLIQPPPNDSAYMTGGPVGSRSRHHGRTPPDANLYPDNMTVFNRGPVEVIEADGSVGMINGGQLPLVGGHSTEAVGARTAAEGIEWLHREGRWAHLKDDLGLVGRAYPVESGRFAGAVLFLGSALPGMTIREAKTVNASSYSAEVWEDPKFANGLVFIGASRCTHTAWPYHTEPERLAASTGQDGDPVWPIPVVFDDGSVCTGAECRVFTAEADPATPGGVSVTDDDPDPNRPVPLENGPTEEPATMTNPNPDPEPEPEPAPAGCGQKCRCKNQAGDLTVAPVITADADELAEVDDHVTQIKADLETLTTTVASLQEVLTRLTAHVFGPEQIGTDNKLSGFDTRLGELESTIKELADRIGAQSNDRPEPADTQSPAQSGPGR